MGGGGGVNVLLVDWRLVGPCVIQYVTECQAFLDVWETGPYSDLSHVAFSEIWCNNMFAKARDVGMHLMRLTKVTNHLSRVRALDQGGPLLGAGWKPRGRSSG